MEGSVVSIFTVSESELELPARSETEQDTAWEPSPVTLKVQGPEPESVAGTSATAQEGAPSRPEPPSEAVTVSVTGELRFQPLDPSAVWETWIDGFVVSIVTVSESELELPARSLTEQDTECEPAPVTSKVHGPVPVREAGELSTVQDGAPSNPEPESDEVTVSVTGAVTFQPLEPSAVWETVMAGFVVSIFTVSE